MADRRQYFKKQIVTATELNAGFNGLEVADRNLAVDDGTVGLKAGGAVTQHAPTPDLTVDVTALTAYDPSGQRMRVPTLQTVNMAVDSGSTSTAVTTPGNSKIVSLFVRFRRAPGDERIDGDQNQVYFIQDESFEFRVVQGSEAVSPTAPALLSDAILLADITRTQGQTQIVNGNISTARTQWAFITSAGAISIRKGTAKESDQGIVTELNNHTLGVSNIHPATAISAPLRSSSPTSLAAGSVDSQLALLLAAVNARARHAAAEAITAAYTFSAGLIVNTVGAIFNALATFNAGLVVASGQEATYSAQVTCRQRIALKFHPLEGATTVDWEYDNGRPIQNGITNSEVICIPVEGLPRHATITLVEVGINPENGHAGMPAVKPRVELVGIDDGGVVSTDQLIDPVSTIGPYETAHSITLTPSSPRSGTDISYQIRIRGEGGANALAPLVIHAIYVTWTTNRVAEATYRT